MQLRLLAIPVLISCCGALRADFTYEQTSKITGGAIVSMMKFAGAFSKDARAATEPIVATVSVKGNRMVHRNQRSAQIIDVDKETITLVDFDKKTYSVMTFAQMKEMMEQMQQKMKQSQKSQPSSPDAANMEFKVDVKDTGQTKSFAGQQAHEMIMTMAMQGTDAKSGAKGGLDMNVDMWVAPSVPGYDEVRAFNRRMAEKLNWTPGANPMMARPEIARGMAELYKEGAKLDGMPVYEVIRMGGQAEGVPQSSSSNQQAAPPPPPPSAGDALANALGGRLGGFGGLGRRKKTQEQPKQEPAADQAQSGGTQTISGSLMEMTMEVTSFSSAPADPSKFEVPSVFNKVEEPMGRGRGR